VLAGIKALPGTLHDRSIVIRMRRARQNEVLVRFDPSMATKEAELCRMLARFAADNFDEFETVIPSMPEGVYNRLADNWRPLFSIAQTAGGDWPERAERALKLLNSTDDEDGQSLGVQLLADIRDLLHGEICARHIPAADLVAALVELDGRPWAEFGRAEKPLTSTKLARMLSPFDIHSATKRDGYSTFKGYDREAFEDAFARYLPVETVTPSQAA
jgi:hypothetical protein